MESEQQIIFRDKCYIVISAEQDFILHPAVLAEKKISSELTKLSFCCDYSIKNNQLMADCMTVSVSGPEQQSSRITAGEFPVLYSGVILIGREIISEYPLSGHCLPCYSYRYVYELVFNKGVLVTTADQSKAMLRIRRNLELGLRSLAVKRDIRCIRRYLNDCFIGDYRPLNLKKQLKYLEELKKRYREQEILVSFSDRN